jgi:hypothetical protein
MEKKKKQKNTKTNEQGSLIYVFQINEDRNVIRVPKFFPNN